MVTMYGIRNCDACRKAMKWLQDNDIEYGYFDIRESGLDVKLLSKWLKNVGPDKLLNRRSATWRKIPQSERDQLNEETARDMVLRYPTVMKRPVLDLGHRVIFGFDPSVYSESGLGK